jgi:hypothetical protein
MTTKGIYRSTSPGSNAEYANVHYGTVAALDSIPRDLYEERGYQPPFDELPTKEEYEAANK